MTRSSESGVVTVTPHLHTVRLDLRIFENASNGPGTDRADQTGRHERDGQRGMGPQDARKPEVRRRATRRGNHLVPLQRSDLWRPAGTQQVFQPLKTTFPEALEPLPDTGSTGSQIPRNGRDRFPLRSQ